MFRKVKEFLENLAKVGEEPIVIEGSEKIENENDNLEDIEIVGEDKYSYIVIRPSKVPEKERKGNVLIHTLRDYLDIKPIIGALRDTKLMNIMFIRISPLKKKDIEELKRAIERVKKVADANNYDIIGITEDWIIIYPKEFQVSKISE